LSNYNFLSNNPTVGLLLTEIGSIQDSISTNVPIDTPIDTFDSDRDSTVESCIDLTSIRKELPVCSDLSETDLLPLKKEHCHTLYTQYLAMLDMYAQKGPIIDENQIVKCYVNCEKKMHAEIHLGLNAHVKKELIKILDNWKLDCLGDATTGLYDYKSFKFNPQDLTKPEIQFSGNGVQGVTSSLPELQASGFAIYGDPSNDEGIIDKLIALRMWHPNTRESELPLFGYGFRFGETRPDQSKYWWINTGNRYLNAAIIRVTKAGLSPSTWFVLHIQSML
jgi:hypothetical protein